MPWITLFPEWVQCLPLAAVAGCWLGLWLRRFLVDKENER